MKKADRTKFFAAGALIIIVAGFATNWTFDVSMLGAVGGPTPAVCGNGACEIGENATDCPQDCDGGGVGPTTAPAIIFNLSEKKTRNELNGTLYLYNGAGRLQGTTATSSGKATFSNLDSSAPFTYVVADTVTAPGFYPVTGPVTTRDAGPRTVNLAVESIAYGAPTYIIYNDDGITTNPGTAQAVAANDPVKFRIRVSPATSTYDENKFSDGILAPLLCLDYNANTWPTVRALYAGQEITAEGAPPGHSTVDANRQNTLCFRYPITQFVPAVDYDLTLTLKSGIFNPSSAVATGDSNAGIHLVWYDGCLVEDTGGTPPWLEAYKDPDDLSEVCATNLHSHISNIT